MANVQGLPTSGGPVPTEARSRVKFFQRIPWWRFAAGILAGGAGLALTFLLRLLGLGVFLPELAVDFAVGRIPGSIESFFIRTMGEGAKVLALTTSLVVFLVLPGVYAIPFRWVQGSFRRRWTVIAVYTFVPAAIALFAILPILEGGFLGTQTEAGPWAAAFSQILGSWLYASILDYLLVEVASRHPKGFSLSRRQFIATIALASAGFALALYGFTSLVSRAGRLVFASSAEMFAKEITPTGEFYVVTKNLIDPNVDASSWRLAIDGLVVNPMNFTYDDLLLRSNTEELVTFECVSNEVGGNLISTARWSGIRLQELLGAAGIDPSADWVVFESADGYTVGIPLGRAMHPSTLVAIHMNSDSAPLTMNHGFPARIVVPGLYGMFDAKWVTRITVVRGEYLGFWQQKGWTNGGAIRTTAIIATPPPDSVVGGAVEIGGVAFAGDRGISRVDVSTDGGATWSPATIFPALSPFTWTLWAFRWTPLIGGTHRIVARAIDGTGAAQESSPEPPFPNGASGYDSIALLVSG